MIINSRQPRPVEELTPNEIYENAIVKVFGKPIDLIKREVKAAEEHDLECDDEGDCWE